MTFQKKILASWKSTFHFTTALSSALPQAYLVTVTHGTCLERRTGFFMLSPCGYEMGIMKDIRIQGANKPLIPIPTFTCTNLSLLFWQNFWCSFKHFFAKAICKHGVVGPFWSSSGVSAVSLCAVNRQRQHAFNALT